MAELVLYGAPQSTCSQRVRFALNAKALPFEELQLDLGRGDQLTPDYLKINPNAVVPTLVHNGEPIVDSAVILEYLDEISPEPVCFTPPDALGRARMRSLMRFIDEVPSSAVRIPSYNLAFLPRFQAMTEEEFLAEANSKPLRKEFLLKMGRTGFPKPEMDSALDRLFRAVKRMDEAITGSGGPWMMGSVITLADIAMMPSVVRMEDINLDYLWDGRPNIPCWLDLIRTHPAFEPTYYFGSLLTEKYSHLAEMKRTKSGRSELERISGSAEGR
ncbi:glutathione S-transferase family protein [Propylenella binzhouense]|uniref:Glutathione S-transferase family protein n=1 Tax=Propylenella binzhouense TaxID=2555902 RepID=A0A964T2L7_9HYPH|nr:glutathione S-transferase N-terminal domain-containing protein [Propylenella binzhouense]MYZ47154.1 glutathione S-transferase family protein [Propylenella binzhouense]